MFEHKIELINNACVTLINKDSEINPCYIGGFHAIYLTDNDSGEKTMIPLSAIARIISAPISNKE